MLRATRCTLTTASRGSYSSHPFQALQQVPYLARIMVEAPNVKLVTGITLLPLHKPLDIAEQLATLDIMSGGRLVFGSGIGYREVEFKAFGTGMSERGKRFEEGLIAIRRLWTEDFVSMQGSHFELDEACVSAKPLQKPTPPFWIGANNDVAVRRAARMADTWFINPHQRMDTIARQLSLYRQTLAELEKPEPYILPLMRECFVAETEAKAVELARPYLEAKYKAYHEWGQDKAMPAGDNDLSMEYDELSDGRFVFGSVDEVAEQIIALAKAVGFNQLGCPIQWVGMPQNHVLDQMHLMAEQVLPRVRQGM